MRRLVLLVVGLACLVPATPSALDRAKERERGKVTQRVRLQSALGLGAVVVRSIDGNPLTIKVGDDMSFQIFNSAIPGAGQIFPSDCTSTADMGVFARVATALYAPDWGRHPCGSASGIGTPWTPVSISAVTGTGTAANPFTVVVVADAGATGLRLTMTVTYVNGDNFFRENYFFTSTGEPTSFDVFTGADIFLADSDSGVPFFDETSGSPGGTSGSPCNSESGYTILFIPLTPAERHSANGFSTVWSEIEEGTLSNTVATGCLDNGAALQWSDRTVGPNSPLTIQTATSFGTIPTIAQFRVDTVTPNSGNPGQTLTVVVTGIGFQSGTTFSFGPGITINSTTINSSTQATLSITIASGAKPGFRDVVGTQSPSGLTSTLRNGFQVGTGGTPTPSQTPTATPTPTPTATPTPPVSQTASPTPTSTATPTPTPTATPTRTVTPTASPTPIRTPGCGTITISPSALFEGFMGVAYRRTFTGNGGTGPYSFSLTSGALPPGLTLSGNALSGTPTAAGTYTFRIRAVDSNGCSGSQTYTLTIGCPPVALSPAALPPASQGVVYAQTITVLGGAGPYSFSVTGGALPAGLTLLPSGSFSGAPTQLGTFSFTITATDANGCTGVQSYTLTVCAALTLAPAALPRATLGVPYSQTIVASGGTGPHVFTQTGLPSPLTLSPTTGVLSGTPSAPGVFTVTVTATDANGCTGMQTYILTVCPILALSPESLPGGAVGIAYSQTIVASGGTAPYQYSASGLPSFLTLSQTTGVLSGTPTASGTLSFNVTATDASGCAVSRSYTILVTDAPPVITSVTLTPDGAGGFILSVAGSGFVPGAVVVFNGVTYPATFVSSSLLTVALPASAVPTTGPITVTAANPGATGGTSSPTTLTFCNPPGAPSNPTIEPFGNPTGPLTATDFLLVRWQAPAVGPPPVAYEFRINGDSYTVVGATSAVAPPRGSNDPITLFVRAKCNANVAGPESSSATYSLGPPVADFTFSAARVGSPVSFTDTSSPQATSWLWIFDDGGTSTLQSPTHTFATAGTHRVALIASNGSGSSQRIKDVPVGTSTTGGGATTSSLRFFEGSDELRWRLAPVSISRAEPAWLKIRSAASDETVVYLRFLDPDGRLVLERRLSIAPGEPAVNDVSAYGLEGTYTLEIVSREPIAAALTEPDEGNPPEGGRRLDENP